jgi:hypothetical protein
MVGDIIKAHEDDGRRAAAGVPDRTASSPRTRRSTGLAVRPADALGGLDRCTLG